MCENRYHQRGRRLIEWREVLNRHAKLVDQPGFRPPKRWHEFWRWFTPDDPLQIRIPDRLYFTFGGLPLPWNEATTHFLILGATGSGKSVQFQLMMNDVLRQLELLPDQRVFITDPKGDVLPTLLARGLKPTVFDPFDERSSAWDLAADIQNRAEAQQFAKALIPSAKSNMDSFWENATRGVLAAVVNALAFYSPGRWNLRDVLLVMRSPEAITELLERRPETAYVWKNIQGDERTRANLMASFTSLLQRYEVIAALEANAKKRFSIREWIRGSGGILVAPQHPRYREALSAIHRLLFDLIADESLSLPDSDQRRTWLFLDEVRSLGKLEKLFHLSNEGRSKGVVLVLGSQSIEGLQEVYGEKMAREILGQLRCKTFLRTDSHITAKWIESHFGDVEYLVEQITFSSSFHDGKRTNSRTVSCSHRREKLLLASDLMALPPPGPGGQFILLNDLPCLGDCFFVRHDFETQIAALPVVERSIPAFQERPEKHQQLLEWTPKDLKRLKMPPVLTPVPAPDHEAAALFLKASDSPAETSSKSQTKKAKQS